MKQTKQIHPKIRLQTQDGIACLRIQGTLGEREIKLNIDQLLTLADAAAKAGEELREKEAGTW